MLVGKKGNDIWDCSDCLFIHRTDVCKFAISEIGRLGITDPDDVRLKDIFKESKERFFRLGKSIMVLGATSDAGKSLITAAICRVIMDMGFTVTPMKTQNMSLNSVVTHDGSEIAMIQELQSKAAGITRPNHHINPILLKPKGNTISQVMVNGRPFNDYDVPSYYNEFVPGPGIDAVRKSVDYLRKRYDFVVIEGAGSPAEINIYDTDIANMKAAEIADASCMLVTNTEWGGSFAYALGTVELIPERDRERIRGFLFNNLRGNTEEFNDAAGTLASMIGIPFLGTVPHIDLELPTEDSAFFNRPAERRTGRPVVAVVRLPRISNFTDIDPLYMEDVDVLFTDDPKEIVNADAVIIPGTKNTISDLKWMDSSGISDVIRGMVGKVPILGICGGYQMMGSVLKDPNGIEGNGPSETAGLGIFDDVTTWDGYTKNVRQVKGTLIPSDGEIRGYEIHMGETVVNSSPLFRIDDFKGGHDEGSADPERMVFGTYLHGVFGTPPFRRYFLSFISDDFDHVEMKDQSERIEENLIKLANAFRDSVDMDAFRRIFMEDSI